MESLHIILEALQEHYSRNSFIFEGCDYADAIANEPKSHVFFPGSDEPYDEDDIAIIKDIGERDLRAKIAYWSALIDAK